MRECCANCKWWRQHTDRPNVGDCTRHPPQVIATPGGPMSMFPASQTNMVCGEHTPGVIKPATAADLPPLPTIRKDL